MKKLTALLMGLMMTLSLAACTGETPSGSSQAEGSQTAALESSSLSESSSAAEASSLSENSSPAGEDASTAGEETGDASETADGKTLVVYFSATGNTEEAANLIAQATGGDLFELEPADPYTSEDLNYGNEDSRVSREYADESLRDVELVRDTVDNWDEYDTVFIGYPIWWGIAAWPVDTFVEANDFTGKTVIPFCTSASSGLGQSGELLAEMAGTGDWQEGMRFRSSVSEADVQEWLDGLGL